MNRSEIPLLLASASPRRLDLLRAAGFKPQVRIPEVDESPRLNETAVGLVERLAITKAKSIGEKEWLTVAGDTVVEIRGEILGKPESPEEAVRMLEKLSGSTHRIIGGWCVLRGERIYHGVEQCLVEFRTLQSDEIDAYVESGEPSDKAGSYAIQGGAGGFVRRFSGFWSNAIGLPLIPVTSAVENLFVSD
ncbi:septum formation protein Maf [bacterium TMED181]|nr:septum formation protein Maf [Planctomycetota bacterium]OUW43778.1 MAG: septum formation protein Maf [bacterium TMED181]